jgi:Bacterial capsule synthesis protein PGA_cap
MKQFLPTTKQSALLAILLIFVFGAATFAAYQSGSFGNNPGGNSDNKTSDTSDELQKYELSFPMVILSKFKTLENDISLEQLRDREVYFEKDFVEAFGEENIEKFKEDYELGETKVIQDDVKSINSAKYPDNAVILTHFARSDFQAKMLKLDGKNLFKDEGYKLTFSYESETEADKTAELDSDFQEKLALETKNDLRFETAKVNDMFLGGEIIPARAVDRLFLNKSDNYTFLFDRFKEDMISADLTVSMLENPIAGNPAPCTGCTTFVGDGRNAKGFKDVGIDLLGFGNHSGDGGLSAVQETEKLLKEQGIGFTGVSSKNLDDAARLETRQFGDYKVGFLSADDVAWFYWAGEDKWGTNRFSMPGRGTEVDHERIKKVVGDAKKEVDFLIVMESWGVEYTAVATPHQVEMAHAFIDAGADLLVNSHPHWVQNFEVYKGKPIFYALGNFIFDQTHTTETRQGMVVKAFFLNGKPVAFDYIPHLNCGYHQSNTNLADKVISGEMTYKEVDALTEKQGCIYWQPKPLDQSRPEYKQTWDRFMKGTEVK